MDMRSDAGNMSCYDMVVSLNYVLFIYIFTQGVYTRVDMAMPLSVPHFKMSALLRNSPQTVGGKFHSWLMGEYCFILYIYTHVYKYQLMHSSIAGLWLCGGGGG